MICPPCPAKRIVADAADSRKLPSGHGLPSSSVGFHVGGREEPLRNTQGATNTWFTASADAGSPPALGHLVEPYVSLESSRNDGHTTLQLDGTVA